MLKIIDPKGKFFSGCFTRQFCIRLNNKVIIKDISFLRNINLKNVILIDNNLYAFWKDIDKKIPIIPFYGDVMDKELLKLTNLLSNMNKKNSY